MKMRKIFILLLVESFLVHTSISQTLLEQIKNSYNLLDTVSYIENVILSYKVDFVVRIKEPHIDSIIVRPTYNHLDLIQRQKLIDSLMRDMSLDTKNFLNDRTADFIFEVKDKPIHFVLNLIFEKREHFSENSFFRPDTSNLSFNLVSFDKRLRPQFYVYIVEGKYVEYHSVFPTFIRQAGKNVRKIYKKILRKNPQYILDCHELEGGNTIWYVLNDKIYLYRIMQMKKYELDAYIKKFGDVESVHYQDK